MGQCKPIFLTFLFTIPWVYLIVVGVVLRVDGKQISKNVDHSVEA